MTIESKLALVAADELRAVMGREKLTQAKVARALNRSQAYISGRANGQAALDLEDIEKLANLIGRDPFDLLLELVSRAKGASASEVKAENQAKKKSDYAAAARRR